MKSKSLTMVSVGLMASILMAGNVNAQQPAKREPRQIFFSPGIVLSSDALATLPNWVKLNPDGTLPEVINIPEDVEIPSEVTLPARVVEIPELDKQGKQAIKRYEVPESVLTIPAHHLSWKTKANGGTTGKGKAALFSPAQQSQIKPFAISVVGTTQQHCPNDTTNRARWNNVASPSVPNLRGRAHSSLNTWTPTEGEVQNWNFGGANPNVYMCIPTSLWYTWIASQGPWLWFYQALYNDPNNWWIS